MINPTVYRERMKDTVALLNDYLRTHPDDDVGPVLRSIVGLIQLQGNILGENLGTITNAVSTLVAERNDIHGIQ